MIIDELEKCLGEAIPRSFESPETNSFLIDMCKKHGIRCEAPKRTTRLIDKLADKLLCEMFLNPTFIMDHPQIIGPMAKYHREGGGLTERFDLFVDKYEELADHGKEVEMDETFILFLGYGMPPTAGWGIGIDRLLMLLTGSSNIMDVISERGQRRSVGDT